MAKKAVRKTNNSRTFFFIVCAIALVTLISLPILSKMEDKKEKDKISSASEAIDYDRLPYLGDPDAKVKIAIFEDFKCTACKYWEQNNFNRLKTDYIDTGKAKLYFINFAFIGPDSTTAAHAGIALYKQNPDYFWKYYQLMYENQGDERQEWANKDFIINLVKTNIPEADAAALETAMDSKAINKEFKADMKIVDALGIDSTPTLLVGNEKVKNGNNYDMIKTAVEAALNKGEGK